MYLIMTELCNNGKWVGNGWEWAGMGTHSKIFICEIITSEIFIIVGNGWEWVGTWNGWKWVEMGALNKKIM